MRDPDPTSLSASVDAVVRGLRGTSARSVAGLFEGWDEAVGPQVAAHARPLVLDAGTLVVEVDEPGWATQLRFLEHDLIERLGEHLHGAALSSIEVRVKGR